MPVRGSIHEAETIRRIFIALILLVAVGALASGSGGSSKSGAGNGHSSRSAMTIDNFAFSPATVSGGFAVVDGQQHRLHDGAIELGFTDLHDYLRARCEHASPAQMARELGATTPVIHRLLDRAGLTPYDDLG